MSNHAPQLPDNQARRDAATIFDTNIVVLAGAGTGKTSLLVERFLNILGTGHAGIEEITAITFTEKAASEMRTRLAAGLEELLERTDTGSAGKDGGSEAFRSFRYLVEETKLDPDEVRRRILNGLNRIDRVQVVTMHAFCGNLLRSWPVEAGVDPGFQVDTGDRFDKIKEEEWERFVADELADGAPRLDVWKEILQKVELDELRKISMEQAGFNTPREILDNPDQTFDAWKLLGPHIEEMRGGLRRLLLMQVPKEKRKGGPSTCVKRMASLITAFEVFEKEGLERFLEHVKSNLDLKKVAQQPSVYAPDSVNPFEGVDSEDLQETVQKSVILLRDLWAVDDDTAGKILRITTPFAARARTRLLREGYMPFDAMTTLARDLLRDNPAVRQAVRRQIKMLLVDEFQDTDPVLYDIVLLLGEVVDGAASNPFEAKLEPGRLFVVGDAKQSIYRFRGADYTAFRSAVDRIESQGGLLRDLTTNFRTVPEVLEPVNRLFIPSDRSSWTGSNCQPAYVPITAFAGPADDPSLKVEVWSTSGEQKLLVQERREREAAAIAAEIESLRVKHGRPIFARISILMRKWANLQIYLRELREREIPYVVDGGKGFIERPEVTVFLATARTLASPSDQAALLNYLRSPIAGVSDLQLARYARDGGKWDWRRPDHELLEQHPTMREALERLSTIHENIQDLPADVAVRIILQESSLLLTSALAFEGSQRVANLEKLGATAAELSRDGRLSLIELLDLLVDTRFTESDTESPMADERTEAVRILTVHKAKGLENDIIIVPDLSADDGRGKTVPFAVARLSGSDYGGAINTSGIWNLVFIRHKLDEKAHQNAESIRLLYVAATRPRKRLILIAEPGSSSGWAKAISPWRPNPEEDVLFRQMEMNQDTEGRGRERPPPATQHWTETFQATVANLHRRCTTPFRAPSAHDEERFSAHEDPDTVPRTGGTDRDEAKALGTAVHQALENWDPEKGDPVSDHSEASKMLRDFTTGPLGKRFREIDIKGLEVPMLMNDAGGFIWRGFIDLLYEEDGKFVVADFKTDAGLRPDKARQRYGPQLKVYGEAVKKAMNLTEPPRLELWMIRDGVRIEI